MCCQGYCILHAKGKIPVQFIPSIYRGLLFLREHQALWTTEP